MKSLALSANISSSTHRRPPRKHMIRRLCAASDQLAELAAETDQWLRGQANLADGRAINRCLEALNHEMVSVRGSLAKCAPGETASNSPFPSVKPMDQEGAFWVRLVNRCRICGRRLGELLTTATSCNEWPLAQQASALLLITEKLIWLVQHSVESQPVADFSGSRA